MSFKKEQTGIMIGGRWFTTRFEQMFKGGERG